MARSLNLLIIDEKKQIADPLSKYLNDRFGSRVDISTCYDAEGCLLKMSPRSHILILDYPAKNENKGTNKVMDLFNRIRKRGPQNKISIISSAEDMPKATEEIERKTNEYVLRREQYVEKAMLLIDQTLMPPFRKKFHEYNVQDFVVMFAIAFCSMAFIYFVFLRIFAN